MFLGFLCAQAGENSTQTQLVALCPGVLDNFFFTIALVFAQDRGLSDDSPPVLHHLSCATCVVLAPVLVPLFYCNSNSGQPCKGGGWQCGVQDGGSGGSCRQNAHAMHPCKGEYARAMRWYHGGCQDAVCVHLQAIPGCFTDVLHDILEGNPDPQLVVVRPSGEDLEHLFEYTAATVDGEGPQNTV